MSCDIDDVIYQLRHLIFNMNYRNDVRRRQRHAVGYLEPLLRKVEKQSYGLAPERQIDIVQVKKALEDLTEENIFSLIPVNTNGLRSAPDWAAHDMLHTTIAHSAFGQGPMNSKLVHFQGQLKEEQLEELHKMRRSLRREVLPELARKLSNDIGAFKWKSENNRRTDGPLAILSLSLMPTIFYFFAAVKVNDFASADRALCLLNWMRFCLPIGDKAVSPGSWFLLTG